MKYICENPKCKKEHDGSYGSGRFCSKKCRMIWIGIESHKTMTKNGTDPKNICSINNKKRRSEYGRWRCLKCNIIFNTRAEYYSHNKKEHPIDPGSSWNKGLTKETNEIVRKHAEKLSNDYRSGKLISSHKGKKMSDETKRKVSTSMKKFFKEHPDRVPYVLHHSSKESYPERYFRELLINEDITGWKHNLYSIGYFLDFGFKDKKIDLEIDGEQHYTDKSIVNHDIIRNKLILENGWKVIRIRWSSWQSMNDINKKQIISYIKDIINYPTKYDNFIVIDKPIDYFS